MTATSSRRALPRRAFLQLLAAGGALAAVPQRASAAPVSTVIVVGAGYAGLSAARMLADAGATVIVLEARTRFGGRAWTTTVGGAGGWADLGAATIHGAVAENPAFDLALSAGTTFGPGDGDITVFDHALGELDSASSDLLFAAIDDFFFSLPGLRAQVSAGASVEAGIQQYLANEGLTGDERRIVEAVLRLVVELDYAGPTEQESLDALNLEPAFGENDLVPIGGYGTLAGQLAAGLDVRLGEVVQNITETPTGVDVTTAGGTLTGSHVIVTVPLAVLKSGAISFSPALPTTKQQAIAALGVGDLEKAVLRFPSVFWTGSSQDSFYVSSQRGEYPLILDLSQFNGEPMMAVHVAAQFARDQAALSDAAVQSAVMTVLQDIFGTSIPSPTAIAVSRWFGDPYSQGAYSFVPTGGSFPADQNALAEPASERVLFAGEATTDYYGTVHGAMLSGQREAARIAALAVPALGEWGRLALPAALLAGSWLWSRRREAPATNEALETDVSS